MKISCACCFTALLSATLCQRAVAASLFNHIGDLSGDPQALEFVPNNGTWFGAFYTAETAFFGVVNVTNPGGSNVLTDWWEVRGGTGPDNNIPWDSFTWELAVHSTRDAAIANPRQGDIANYSLGSPVLTALTKVDRFGVPLELLHFSGLNIPLESGWYSLRQPGYNNYGSGILEGTYNQGVSSDTWIPSNDWPTYVRDHPAHQYSGHLNVAASYAPVPEPGSAAVLSLAIVALLRRRRSTGAG